VKRRNVLKSILLGVGSLLLPKAVEADIEVPPNIDSEASSIPATPMYTTVRPGVYHITYTFSTGHSEEHVITLLYPTVVDMENLNRMTRIK